MAIIFGFDQAKKVEHFASLSAGCAPQQKFNQGTNADNQNHSPFAFVFIIQTSPFKPTL